MTSPSDRQWLFSELVSSVRLLAAEAEEQAKLVPFGMYGELVNCDELALNFEDSYLMVAGLVHHSLLSPEAAQRLEALDAQLKAMSGWDKEELWTLRAVRSDPLWERVRELARSALELLPEPEG